MAMDRKEEKAGRTGAGRLFPVEAGGGREPPVRSGPSPRRRGLEGKEEIALQLLQLHMVEGQHQREGVVELSQELEALGMGPMDGGHPEKRQGSRDGQGGGDFFQQFRSMEFFCGMHGMSPLGVRGSRSFVARSLEQWLCQGRESPQSEIYRIDFVEEKRNPRARGGEGGGRRACRDEKSGCISPAGMVKYDRLFLFRHSADGRIEDAPGGARLEGDAWGSSERIASGRA